MKLRSGSFRKTFRGLLSEYFIKGLPWRDRLGVTMNRYQRGNSLINVFKDIIIILGIGGIMSGIDLSFIPFWCFIILGFLWVIGCYTAGYLDEKQGFWRHQAKHSSGTIDPIISEILRNTKKLLKSKKIICR